MPSGVDTPFFLNYYIFSNRKCRQGITMSYSTDSFYISDENKAYIISKVEEEKRKGNRRFNKSNFIDDLLTHLRLKAESKAKLPVNKPKLDLPEGLNTKAWDMWIDYRKKIKKPLKTSNQAKNLIKLGVTMEGQMAVVMQSINNEYQGLFEVKSNETNQSTNAPSGMSAAQATIAAARQRRDSAQGGLSMGPNDRNLHGQVDQKEWGGRVIDMD